MINKILIFTVLLSQAVSADIVVGNYIQINFDSSTSVDPLTGREVLSFTNSSDITIPLPDRNIWIGNEQFVLFETDMARPQGESSGNGEKQIAAINLLTGDAYWITSLEVEDPFIYGWGHFDISSDAHFTCSRENDLVAYRDITGHHLYLKRLTDDLTIELLHLFAGTFIGTPAISDDGGVVVIEAIHRGPDTDYYDGTNHSIMVFNIDTVNMQVVGDIEIANSFANIKANESQASKTLGYPFLSPDGSWMAFKNKQIDMDGQESYCLEYCLTDGSRMGRFADQIGSVGGLWCKGNDLYFVAEGGFSRANINSTGYQRWRKLLTDKRVKVKSKSDKSVSFIPFPSYRVNMDNLIVLPDDNIIYNILPISYDDNDLGSTVVYELNTITAEKKALVSARQSRISGKRINFHVSGDSKKIVYCDFENSQSKISLCSVE
ncbi:MAG: hypothetical protein ACIAQZ_01895 [Sedimentisphaeraceae bacterium JB056]